jgi:hypothetical protein
MLWLSTLYSPRNADTKILKKMKLPQIPLGSSSAVIVVIWCIGDIRNSGDALMTNGDSGGRRQVMTVVITNSGESGDILVRVVRVTVGNLVKPEAG